MRSMRTAERTTHDTRTPPDTAGEVCRSSRCSWRSCSSPSGCWAWRATAPSPCAPPAARRESGAPRSAPATGSPRSASRGAQRRAAARSTIRRRRWWSAGRVGAVAGGAALVDAEVRWRAPRRPARAPAARRHPVLTRAGTSLVELLVALALGGIVLAVASGSMLRQQRGARWIEGAHRRGAAAAPRDALPRRGALGSRRSRRRRRGGAGERLRAAAPRRRRGVAHLRQRVGGHAASRRHGGRRDGEQRASARRRRLALAVSRRTRTAGARAPWSAWRA